MLVNRFLLLSALALGGCGEVATSSAISPGNDAAPRFGLQPGMVKPVTNVREYNGTLYGRPNTGSWGYSTLYRDNYDTPGSGLTFTGEGSGQHTGVDILAPSGTSVYATQAGVIERNDCLTAWGGLVVIKSPNIYWPGHYVYHTYAHMKSRTTKVAKGTPVAAGEQIGVSGGASTDPCRGNTTGAHLHYQIDNETFSGLPRSQLETTNTPDINNDVNDYTYSPMLYLQGGYSWEFSQPGNAEFWQANVTTAGVSGDAFWMDGNYDPWMQRGEGRVSCTGATVPCNTQIAAEADFYRYVEINLHLNCAVTPLVVYFTTDKYPTFHHDRRVEIPVGYGPATLRIPMYERNSDWRGIITGLRVDPSVNCDWGNEVNYIGYIRLVK